MYTNPSFTKFYPKATRTTLKCGSATDWYIHENVDACLETDYGVSASEVTDKQRLWAKGWFAEIGWNDAYADFRSNSWEGSIVSGPYPTQEEALTMAREICDEKNAKIN